MIRLFDVQAGHLLATFTGHDKHAWDLRVSPDGGLRLTVPRGASLAGGFEFAARQAAWISREMDRQRARQAPWVTGTRTWFRGESVAVSGEDDAAVHVQLQRPQRCPHRA